MDNNIKIVGVIHFILNLFSLGILGSIFVGTLLLLKGKELNKNEIETYNNIINFNLSYYIYFSIAGILCYVLVGLILLPIVAIFWIFLLAIGFEKHLKGKNFSYPTSIKFL